MSIRIDVQDADFDAGAEIAALAAEDHGAGGLASFIGRVRGDADGLKSMTLEHYPAMTEKSLHAIVNDACQRWPLRGVRVIHRVGRLLPGEQIVLVAVAAAHRGEAFAGCEFIMDWLKTKAPFWKKEETAAGARWVDARESDDAAAARWGQGA